MILGINSPHFMLQTASEQDQQVAAIKALGCKYVRIALAWPDLEPVKGTWDWSKSDIAISKLTTLGVSIVAILGGFPTWSNGGKPFYAPCTDMTLWANYCNKVQGRYPCFAFEIMNEQNCTGFFTGTSADYVKYLSIARAQIPASSKVIMGGVAGADPSWLNSAMDFGCLDYVDAIAYHPYPETLNFFDQAPLPGGKDCIPRIAADDLKAKMKAHGKVKPLWATEIGWTTAGAPCVTPALQATFITQSVGLYKQLIDAYFYFQVWDEPNPYFARESGYGLVDIQFKPKPAFTTYKTLIASG